MVRELGHDTLGVLETRSQPSKPNSTGLSGGSVKAPCPAVSTPMHSSSGTQACSGSRDGIATHVRGSEGTKWDSFSFFHFSLISSFVPLVSGQPSDSTMT